MSEMRPEACAGPILLNFKAENDDDVIFLLAFCPKIEYVKNNIINNVIKNFILRSLKAVC